MNSSSHWKFYLVIFFSLFWFELKASEATQEASKVSPTVSAKIQGILIQADSLDRDTDAEIAEMKGNIQIVYNDYHIQSDYAKIYIRSKRIYLSGRVIITQSKSTIGGDQIWLDYESNTGLISKGFVQSGNVIFEGEVISKTGENDYYVVKADYTTCNNCPASWNFQGSQIRAELGGYAYIKNSILRIGSFPVFWFPYLIVPLKSDRQSGLLTPEFESSQSGGLTISQPFFWVISKSQDLTYTFKNYELRGPKSLINYRYVMDENSYGELNTAWLRDKVFQNEDRVNLFKPDNKKNDGFNRWLLKYDHYLTLPDDYVHRLQINNASDLQYPKDFPKESRNYNEPAFENRMSLTKNFENYHSHIETAYNINLLQSNPLSNDENSVHRIPEIKINKMYSPLGSTGLIYNWDFNYLNLTRNGKGYDDLTYDSVNKIRFPTNNCNSPNFDKDPSCKLLSDGKFDPYSDLIRTGQRIDFKPSLAFPLNFNDTIDILPKISYRETQYQFQLSDDSHVYRRYLKAEVATRTQFTKIYRTQSKENEPDSENQNESTTNDTDSIESNNPTINKLPIKDNPQKSKIKSKILDSYLVKSYKHEIIPQIVYTKTPWVERNNHPFWGFDKDTQQEIPFTSQDGISDGDLSSPYGLQFDYLDRSLDRELVTFSVIQRLTKKEWLNDAPIYKQIASLSLSQSFDVFQSNLSDPNKQPWSNIAAYMTLDLDYFTTISSVNYFPYQKVSNVSSSFKLSNKYGNFFEFGLDKAYRIVPGSSVTNKDRTEDYFVRSGLLTKYFNIIGQFVYDGNWINNDTNRKIKSWAYVSQFKPPGDCWLITLAQYQVTSGSPELKLSFEFTFDGNTKPPLTIQALTDLIN